MERQPPFRSNSKSTTIDLNAHAYPPNPMTQHQQHRYDDDDDDHSDYGADRASVLTAVAPHDDRSYHKSRGFEPSRHGEPLASGSLDLEERSLVGRTPSPTPSELKELKSGAVDWQALRSWKFWIRREWLWYYVIGVIIVVIATLVSVYHKQIVFALKPAATWLYNTKGGWVVPVAVLFVISFPPLFGHEIVAILCGVVWGFWVGFGIVAAGTLLGEIGNFYAFKYCCRTRAAKLEKTSISYACLGKVVREGGFKIAVIVRLSAVPGHFTTAIFSTCGMGIIVFTIAAILSMPKQIVTVYLGVILEQSATGPADPRSKIITNIVLVLTVIITILAMWYIIRQMNKVKPAIIYKRRKARQAKLARVGLGHIRAGSETTIVFNAEFDSPLKEFDDDPESNHDPYSATPLVAPQPIRPLSISQRPLDSIANRGVSPGNQSSGSGPYASRDKAREGSSGEVGWDVGAITRQRADNPSLSPKGSSNLDHLDGSIPLQTAPRSAKSGSEPIL